MLRVENTFSFSQLLPIMAKTTQQITMNIFLFFLIFILILFFYLFPSCCFITGRDFSGRFAIQQIKVYLCRRVWMLGHKALPNRFRMPEVQGRHLMSDKTSRMMFPAGASFLSVPPR